MKYINLTPRWTEILPTWLMLYRQGVTGDCTNPDLVKDNARKEFERMAESADRWNDLVAALRAAGWTDDNFERTLRRGRELQETERTTVKEG